MVTGSTATQIGDLLIAKLVDPYENAVRVTDWSILAGVSNQNTVGRITLVEGSTTVAGFATNFNLSAGDFIIVGNTLLEVASQVSPLQIELAAPAPFSGVNMVFYISPDVNNAFTYYYRYSQTGTEYSEFKLLTRDSNPGDLFFLNFDGASPLWIDTKAVVDFLSSGSTITLLDITYTVETADGTIQQCPQYCIGCDDPFAYTGCANIKIDCVDDTNIFKPYALTKSNNMYRQLVEISTDIFGHDVRYWRVEPDDRTRDVTFMEYSLFNVVEEGSVKVSVPDNEFPTEALQYDMFGIGFDDFEIHIADYQFEKAFGSFKRPRVKDYLFFPLNNKMYEVKSVALADEFNINHTYWRVMLTKFQNHSAVIKDQTFTEDLQSLVVGVDDIFGAEISAEATKVTKPQQFKSTSHIWSDGVRNNANAMVKIVDYDLKNRWTIVAKHHYDLAVVPTDDMAVQYVQRSVQSIDDNLAFTAWFQPTFESTDSTKYTMFWGEQFGNGLSVKLSGARLDVTVNGQVHSFVHNMILSSTKWYAVVINMSNTYRELGVYIYYMDESLNLTRPQDGNNNLTLQFSEIRPVTQAYIWDVETQYQLRGAKLKMTNIRLWKKAIEEEQHSNVLNQSLVRDADLALIIDNAIPALSYQRYRNSR